MAAGNRAATALLPHDGRGACVWLCVGVVCVWVWKGRKFLRGTEILSQRCCHGVHGLALAALVSCQMVPVDVCWTALAATNCFSRLQLQWPYDDWLAQAAGADVPLLVENWRPDVYAAARVNRSSHPEDYRDR